MTIVDINNLVAKQNESSWEMECGMADIAIDGDDVCAKKKFEQEYLDKIKEQCFSGDPELDHAVANDLICDLLRNLGYESVVKLYGEVDKWYA